VIPALALMASVVSLVIAGAALVVAVHAGRFAAALRPPIERLAEQVTVAGRAVTAASEAAQADRVVSQARRVSLQLVDTYEGGDDLPGAAEVLAVNHSEDLIYQVSIRYSPAGGEPQVSDRPGRPQMITPHTSFRHVFTVPPGTSRPEPGEFELRFLDTRSCRWSRSADATQPRLIGRAGADDTDDTDDTDQA